MTPGLVVLALFICWGGAAIRQVRWSGLAEPVFRNIRAQEGLPNPAVTAIAEDADRFLWVGTQGDLARWDGYHFRIYKPLAGVSGALPDSWITALHTDPGGNLWIGTTAGGRDHLISATGHIAALRHIVGDAQSLPSDNVEALLRGRTGVLWVGTCSGLARYQPSSNRFVTVPLAANAPQPVAILSLFEAVCLRITESFGDAINFRGQPMRTSASIGVSLWPLHGNSREALYHAADRALYQAKRAGKNTWRWYDAFDQNQVTESSSS